MLDIGVILHFLQWLPLPANKIVILECLMNHPIPSRAGNKVPPEAIEVAKKYNHYWKVSI